MMLSLQNMVRKAFYPEHCFANKSEVEISYHRGKLLFLFSRKSNC